MKKTFEFEEVFEATPERLWEIIKKPSEIIMEKITRFNLTNDLMWEEVPSNGVYNVYEATLDKDNYKVHIVSHNSKYKSESNDIIMHIEAIDDTHSKVHVHYQVGTTAIFNIVALEVASKPLSHHVSHTIFHNIKKRV